MAAGTETPARDSNLSLTDFLDAAERVYRVVDPPNTTPPSTTQVPAPVTPATSFLDTLKASPAMLVSIVAAVGLVIWLAVRR